MEDRPALTPEEAIEMLGKRLHWNMERFDPSDQSEIWRDLDDATQRFYKLLVSDLIEFEDLIQIARGLNSVGSSIAS